MSWFNSFINLSPIWFFVRWSVLSVCVKKSVCVLCGRRENQLDCFILLWTFAMWEMRRRLKCRFHWRRINAWILTVPTIIQLMETKRYFFWWTIPVVFIAGDFLASLLYLMKGGWGWRAYACSSVLSSCSPPNHLSPLPPSPPTLTLEDLPLPSPD